MDEKIRRRKNGRVDNIRAGLLIIDSRATVAKTVPVGSGGNFNLNLFPFFILVIISIALSLLSS